MPDRCRDIYAHEAELYDRLVAREDHQGRLLAALERLRPLAGLEVVEMGAGTGRLTRLLAPRVRAIRAFDSSRHMLETAAARCRASGLANVSLAVADHRALPVKSGSAGLAIEGWSFGHLVEWHPDSWREHIARAVGEMKRVLRPGGTAVVIETLGTGRRTPQAPTPELEAFYRHLEDAHGYQRTWTRTDFRFESVAEAQALMRFFFGDAMAGEVARSTSPDIPECTGVWWAQAIPARPR